MTVVRFIWFREPTVTFPEHLPPVGKKGYNYIYNIRMSPQGIEIADVKVAGWNDGGSVDIPVE